MAVDTLLFFDDIFHYSNTAALALTPSSTEGGYHQDNVRDTSWAAAWKPTDSSSDEYWAGDAGSSAPTGACYVAIAYDARGCDQNVIKVQVDASDNVAGTFAVNKATFTLDKRGPTVDYAVVASWGTKRYVRLYQYVADRSGTRTAKIFAFAICTGVKSMANDFSADTPAPGDYALVSKTQEMKTASGIVYTNRGGSTDQEFELNLNRATASTWQTIRDELFDLDNNNRAFFLQYTGLRNYARADFQLVRVNPRWAARRPLQDQFETSIQIATEPWY